MVFTSHIFIFYFLPLCLALYYLLPRRLRNTFLTVASYIFYGWWKPWFVSLMMASTIVDYTAGRVMSHPGASPRRRKAALLASLLANLGLLGVFKYFVFAQENLNWLLAAVGADAFDLVRITLPVGISFYTFQTMSYSIDVYRRVAPANKRFGDISCFVALFPQLIAGPIVRYNTVAQQLSGREHTLARFVSGALLFMLGFAKKILLANPMGTLADTSFATHEPTVAIAWFGVLAYALQIYFDFAGYSDMAVGLGRMLGFEFPKNFDSPYHSQSITEFWRRWHISLSTFLRDYLYIPLGGNRVGQRRTYLNLAVVMLLGGLWHGAQWQFVAWGAYHGALLAAERWIGKRSVYAGWPAPLRLAITFVLVLFSWVLFRAESLSRAGHYFAAMFGLGSTAAAARLVHADLFGASNLGATAVAVLVVSRRTQAWDIAEKGDWSAVVQSLVLFAVALAAMFTQAFNPFLYFQF